MPAVENRNTGKFLILLITVVAAVVGGATESWARGIVTVLMGLAWITAPPKYSLGRLLNGLVLALFLVATLAFLPVSWIGIPGWRESLSGDLGLPLPATLSPQPWITLDALLQLAVALLWFVYILGQRWKDEERAFFVQSLAVLIGATALVSLICNATGFWISFWGSFKNLGPFPNRNHFATLLSVGAVLAATCAFDRARQKDRRGLVLFLACLAVCFVAIVINNSRAGIVLLFGGLGAWIGIASLGTRSSGKLAISAGLLLTVAACFLIFGGGLLERFSFGGDIQETLSNEGRIPIYRDCIVLASQNPFLGIGLGNFEGVFALSQKYYQNLDRVIHPESDWVWLGVETGLIGLALAVWLLLLSFMRVGGIRPGKRSKKRQHRLRMGAAIAAAIVPLHGTFDIPGHVMGIVVPAMLLLSLACSNRAPLVPTAWPTRFFRIIALPAIVLGVTMICTHFLHLGVPSNEGAKQLYARSILLSGIKGGSKEAYDATSRAAEIKPLHWEYHFQRGRLAPRVGIYAQEARENFRRARFLEQQSTFVTMAEAEHWLKYYPPYAISPWRETLIRDSSRLDENYGRILGQANEKPSLVRAARQLSNLSPVLKLTLLKGLTGSEFQEELDNLLLADPNLEKLNNVDQGKLFDLWSQKGDYEDLITELKDRPSWNQGGWRILAEHHAKRGEFSSALSLIQTNYIPPKYTEMRTNVPIDQLIQDFYINPTDLTKGLRLFYAQARSRNLDAAIATLDKVAALPGAPSYLGYLRFELYKDTGEQEKAWEAFRNQKIR